MDADAYRGVRDRIISLVGAADGPVAVPSCPSWRVKDIVGHLAGLCEDWVSHHLDGYASEEWTAAQVQRFRLCPMDDVFERWYSASERLFHLDDDPLMGSAVRWAFGDAVTHEADIRGALGAERVPHDAVLIGLKGSISRWREVLSQAKTPTLVLRAPDARDWWLGSLDDPQESVSVVEAPVYEFFRALTGRRSQAQMRRWQWSGDPQPYLAAGLPYPFESAGSDIEE